MQALLGCTRLPCRGVWTDGGRDTIISINSIPVNSLKDLSAILKTLKPGDKVSIIFLRDGKEIAAETEVTAR